MILGRLQSQKAKKLGISVDDAMLTEAVTNIAARNGMTLEELQATLEAGGVRFQDFAADTRLKLVTNRLMYKSSDYRRINATGQSVDNFPFTNSFLNGSDTLIDEITDGPVTLTSAYLISKILEYGLTLRSMSNFRMKLNTIYPVIITHYGYRRVFSIGE